MSMANANANAVLSTDRNSTAACVEQPCRFRELAFLEMQAGSCSLHCQQVLIVCWLLGEPTGWCCKRCHCLYTFEK
jgi:hypothetical protein